MKNSKLFSARKKILSNLILYLMLFFPLSTVKAQTWQQQVSGIGNSLMSVFFSDEFNGWAVGSYGAIVHTTDGGENWNQQTSGTNKDLNCVVFMDPSTGWICGSQGTILKTIDGGNNWSPQNSLTVYNLLSIVFTNDSTGWVTGVGGTILKTTNGGTNWVSQNSPFSEYINDVDFVDSLYGWAATFASGQLETTIIKTTDGGDFWELVTVPMLIPWPVLSIDFLDRNIGWVVGYPEIILKSFDGGNTWIEQQFSTPETALYSVSFADENNGWTVGEGGVIGYTSDGGNIWETQTSGTNNILWDVFIVNPTTGWIVGDNGLILKYTTPVSIDDAESESIPNRFSLEQNYPNPFNPTTTIIYTIPVNSVVSIKLYNSLGQQISTLLEKEIGVGEHKLVFNAGNLPSNVFFYQLKAGDFIQIKKMLLMK